MLRDSDGSTSGSMWVNVSGFFDRDFVNVVCRVRVMAGDVA